MCAPHGCGIIIVWSGDRPPTTERVREQMKVIKFAAKSHTYVGEMIRLPRPEAKFWKVYKIVDGKAYAKPAGFGTDPRVACC